MLKDREKLKKFNGKLGSYTPVSTDDSSITLYSEFFDENCHSTSGALDETRYNYLEGCEVLDKARKQSSLTIFEVGLGLGLGPKICFEELQDQKTQTTFISTEIDEGLVIWAKENIDSDIFENLEKQTNNELVYYESSIKNFKLIILVGDARVTTPKANSLGILKSVDAIFQDPFSPKKNPILWTKQWFELLYLISSEDSIMSTYSSHTSVRKSMMAANWRVFKRVGFGEKRSMTVCRKSGEMNPDILRNLKTSPDPLLLD
jgi:tRNA U34 5-methylaminomethyl-2-thiouridine-forming methyltransferase MnmC